MNGIRVELEIHSGTFGDDTTSLWIDGDSDDGGASTADRVDAMLDEVRLSRVARSEDWIDAEVAAGRDELLVYGAVQSR